MNCPSCGKEVEADSNYCEYCGKRVSATPEEAVHESLQPDQTVKEITEKDQDSILPKEDNENNPIVENSRDKKNGQTKTILLYRIAVSVLTILLLSVCLFGAGQISVQKDRINKLNELIAENQEKEAQTKTYYTNRITEYINRIAELENNNALLKRGLIAQTSYPISARASSHFRVDQEVVVINQYYSEQLILTAYWPAGGTVSISASSNCASFEYGRDSWNDTVPIYIKGESKGLCVLSFSNDQDSGTFNVLVVVI